MTLKAARFVNFNQGSRPMSRTEQFFWKNVNFLHCATLQERQAAFVSGPQRREERGVLAGRTLSAAVSLGVQTLNPQHLVTEILPPSSLPSPWTSTASPSSSTSCSGLARISPMTAISSSTTFCSGALFCKLDIFRF